MNALDMPLTQLLPQHLDLFYAGRWHSPRQQGYAETFDPSTGEAIASVALADEEDVNAAVAAAAEAFRHWRHTSPQARSTLLRQAASLLREHAQQLALLDAWNTGNPVRDLLPDVEAGAACLDYFAGLITQIKGETQDHGQGRLHYTLREPLGVVARIVAYNHPLMFAAMKIAAPLAAGNTVILKAAEQAPLSALRMMELFAQLFPPGVLNVLHGTKRCGQALAAHPGVKKITLIGSVPSGKAVMRAASDTLKPVLLELGGKNALIACADADAQAVIDACVRGMNFAWAGQSCGSTSRAFIHDSLYEQVVAGVAKLVGERHQPGIATRPETTMGPVINKTHFERVMRYIGEAQQEGARLIAGGRPSSATEQRGGYFIEPTIFADVDASMRIAREEIFGPVLAIFRWTDEADMLEQVNATDYGLTASIWTRNLASAHRLASKIDAGYLWVNEVSRHFLGAPFGGYKQSGLGREESFEELIAFSQLKSVHVKFEDAL
ncbi:MAG: aldehyde dehydrogenase family protein [Pigmentiphaga sp.]